MHMLFSILVLFFISFSVFSEQGTMSTDDTTQAQAEASLSGVKNEDLQLQEEDLSIEDDIFDPNTIEEDYELDSY
jgi:hypothetical protein